MIIYVDNPRVSVKKIELINSVKLQNIRATNKKSVLFLYINNKLFKKETKKTISFIMTSKRIKYLGLNLTKEVKAWYTENYKVLMSERKEETNLMENHPVFRNWKG